MYRPCQRSLKQTTKSPPFVHSSRASALNTPLLARKAPYRILAAIRVHGDSQRARCKFSYIMLTWPIRTRTLRPPKSMPRVPPRLKECSSPSSRLHVTRKCRAYSKKWKPIKSAQSIPRRICRHTATPPFPQPKTLPKRKYRVEKYGLLPL